MPIKEFHLSNVLEGYVKKCPKTKINLKYCFSRFEFSQEQFVDLCILLGCDYVDKIKGVGPKKAIELVSSCLFILIS